MYPVRRKDNSRNKKTWFNKSRNGIFTYIVMVNRICNGDLNRTATDMCKGLSSKGIIPRSLHDNCSEGSEESYFDFIANVASLLNFNIMLFFIGQFCI